MSFKEELEIVGKKWYGEHYIIDENDENIWFIFWYPQKEIRNSEGLSHLMRDVGFEIKFRKNGEHLQYESIQFFRLTISYLEYLANYGFSHAGNGYSKGNLCFGSGPLNATIGEVYETNWFTPDMELFELFLFQLDIYLGWESIEGGPYRRMNNIGAGGASGLDLGRALTYKQMLLPKDIVIKFREAEFNYYEVDEKILKRGLNRMCATEDLVVINSETGEEIGNNLSTEEQSRLVADIDLSVTLGTKTKQIEVIPVQQNVINRETSIKPKILKHIKRELEKSINQYIINDCCQV